MTRLSEMRLERFDRHGMLALDPRAFLQLFVVPEQRANERHDGVEVIDVSGPIDQRAGNWCDSYEAIRARMAEACAGEASVIVMRFDSPGGEASGCFETARALRDMAAAAHKPLIAYVDRACSAAYALASAASAVVIGESCCAGSIGVISSRPDVTAQNAQHGIRVAFVTSGQRKLDGNPEYPVSDEELARTQVHVDDLAQKFFALIADMRPQQLTAAAVAGFDGGVFYGDGAVAVGLADSVATFDETLALARTGNIMTLQAKSDYDMARASLAKVAKGTDANAAAAKRALAALAEESPPKEDEDEPASEEGEEKEPDAEDEEEKPAAEGGGETPAAEDGGEPPDDAPKKKAAAAPAAATPAAASSTTEVELAARVHRLEAAAAQRDDRDTRRALLAKRPDFGPELRAALAKAPLETVREMVRTLPKGKVPADKRTPAATATVAGTRGATQGPLAIVPSAETEDMDRRMGLRAQKIACRREGSAMLFGLGPDEDMQQPPSAAAKQ